MGQNCNVVKIKTIYQVFVNRKAFTRLFNFNQLQHKMIIIGEAGWNVVGDVNIEIPQFASWFSFLSLVPEESHTAAHIPVPESSFS